MKNIPTIALFSVSTFLLFSCKKDTAPVREQVTITKGKGSIQTEVNAFKNMLGRLNTTPEAIGGYREINWEGVPDSLLNKPLPGDFFNQTGDKAIPSLQKGLNYGSPGNFVVSADGFSTINDKSASQFTAFSGTKTFANTTAVKWEISFSKVGTTRSASVQSFGVVFLDVDKDSSTSIELFNGTKSLGTYFAPVHDATSNFSFIGASFNNGERITSVTVSHHGFLAEGTDDISNGGTRDLVALDDFIFSEPVVQ